MAELIPRKVRRALRSPVIRGQGLMISCSRRDHRTIVERGSARALKPFNPAPLRTLPVAGGKLGACINPKSPPASFSFQPSLAIQLTRRHPSFHISVGPMPLASGGSLQGARPFYVSFKPC